MQVKAGALADPQVRKADAPCADQGLRVLIDRNMDRSSQVDNYKHGVRLTHMLMFPKIGINSIYVNVSKH